jgi:SET domain-containing protein
MIDDDLYLMPLTYMNEQNNDECAFFNHSCVPNCGFSDAFGDNVVAVRDISVGEELTYHYGKSKKLSQSIEFLVTVKPVVVLAPHHKIENQKIESKH